MKLPYPPLSFSLLVATALLASEGAPLRAQSEPTLAAETAKPAEAPAEAAQEPTVGAWILDPASAPMPSRADMEKYITNLQQREQELSKTIEYLVSKKRMRQESAAKDSKSIGVPAEISMDRWDELNKQREDSKVPPKDYSDAMAAFAAKLQTVNTAQQTVSTKLSHLILRESDEDEPVHRRTSPKTTSTSSPAATPAPAPAAATPIPIHRAIPVRPVSKPATPAPSVSYGKPASGKQGQQNN